MRRSYAIIGTGAVGGYYGGCLQKAGFPVHFLLRSDYQQVKERGLIIQAKTGDFTLPQVNAYHDSRQMPPCDVVAIALKSTQNHLLPTILPPLLQPQTVVLLLQNGLGFEPEISQILTGQTLLGGLCFICAHKEGPGHIRHVDYQMIKFGAYAPNYQAVGITATMKEIAQDFEEAGITISLQEDLLQTRWEKLVWNIPYNSLSVLLDATTQEIMSDPNSRQLVLSLMEEVALGAKSCGRSIAPDYLTQMLDHTDQMTPYLTSMKLDYDHHRPLEIEGILAKPLALAQANGVQLPLITMLCQQLKFLQQKQKNFNPKEQS